MVTGLEVFRSWFRGYGEQFVLIGGTAAAIAMEKAGEEFRRTKDLDIVLYVEALTPEFGKRFWDFINAGGYRTRESSVSGRPQLFRFFDPTELSFPYMLELFARAPIGLQIGTQSHLTPIPMQEAISSLSAILLDTEYYDFVMSGKRDEDGLPWVGEDRLIPLKAMAYLDLSARKRAGDPIDSKTITKHLKDVLALSGLLSPAKPIQLPERISDDLAQFIAVVTDTVAGLPDPRIMEILDRLRLVYRLGELPPARRG